MKILTSAIIEPQLDDNVIYISQPIKDYLIEGKAFWPAILRGFRRTLRARPTLKKKDWLKLQGKIELIGELENFFQLKE